MPRERMLQFARFQIHQYEYLFPDEFFGCVVFGNARNDFALVDARIDGQFQQLFRLGDFSAARIVETRISIF